MSFYKCTINAVVLDDNGNERKDRVIIFVESEDYTLAELEAREYAKERFSRFTIPTITKTTVNAVHYMDEDNHEVYYLVKMSYVDLETEKVSTFIDLINGHSVVKVADWANLNVNDVDEILEVVFSPTVDVVFSIINQNN